MGGDLVTESEERCGGWGISGSWYRAHGSFAEAGTRRELSFRSRGSWVGKALLSGGHRGNGALLFQEFVSYLKELFARIGYLEMRSHVVGRLPH
jgi:hypothetical protein